MSISEVTKREIVLAIPEVDYNKIIEETFCGVHADNLFTLQELRDAFSVYGKVDLKGLKEKLRGLINTKQRFKFSDDILSNFVDLVGHSLLSYSVERLTPNSKIYKEYLESLNGQKKSLIKAAETDEFYGIILHDQQAKEDGLITLICPWEDLAIVPESATEVVLQSGTKLGIADITPITYNLYKIMMAKFNKVRISTLTGPAGGNHVFGVTYCMKDNAKNTYTLRNGYVLNLKD